MNNLRAITKEKTVTPDDDIDVRTLKNQGLLKKKPGFGKVRANPKAAAPANLFARLTGK